ncbi:helix-turn-helix domain-containing protein [Spirillospora sp. CA-128828]|uniref:helix-turn-helix domain-containing protein n=1 Tax=Spirillospora sp. CA-128828 TaxID=3240033 RepID=UPI003D90BC0E
MTAPTPMKIEHLIGRNLAELRRERGWKQSDLAWRMQTMGFKWTPNHVTQIETHRRAVSLLEVTALSWVFEVPILRFLSGTEDIEMPDEKTVVPLTHVRAALSGDVSVQQQARADSDVERSNLEEVRKIARTLEIEPRMLDWLAREMFDRPFSEERDARAGDLSYLPERSARSKRGHMSRTMTAEVRDFIDQHGLEKLTSKYRQYQRDKHEETVSRLKAMQRERDVD